jgi:hypothetical protein
VGWGVGVEVGGIVAVGVRVGVRVGGFLEAASTDDVPVASISMIKLILKSEILKVNNL